MNSTSGNPFRRVEEIRQEDIPSDVPPPECDHCWPGVVPSRILTETGRASSCISGSCAGSPLIGFQPVGWYCRGGTNRPTTARRVQESVGQLHVNSAGFLDDELLVPYRCSRWPWTTPSRARLFRVSPRLSRWRMVRRYSERCRPLQKGRTPNAARRPTIGPTRSRMDVGQPVTTRTRMGPR